MAGIKRGPVFRRIDHNRLGSDAINDVTVARVIQRSIARYTDLNPREYGAHSARAGYATPLDAAGVSLRDIMTGGGWKNANVAGGYIRNSGKRGMGKHLGL